MTIALDPARATTPAPSPRRCRDWSGRVVCLEVGRSLAVFGVLGVHVGASSSTEITHRTAAGGSLPIPIEGPGSQPA